MSTTFIGPEDIEQIDLRQQSHFWRAQHARAVKRETLLRAKTQELEITLYQRDAVITYLRQQIVQKDGTIAERDQQIEALKANLVWLKQQLFGRKTEQTESESCDSCRDCASESSDNLPQEPCEEKRKCGQQQGAKGHGRKLRLNLPSVQTIHELSAEQCRCPKCGKPYKDFPGTEDSEEIEWEVILRRHIHKRARYVPTCNCQAVPGIVSAPSHPKLIPKGMFATSFWVHLLMEKFLFQRPLYRVRKVLAIEGLCVSQGTLTGGLKRIGELLQLVYTRILEHSRTAKHWKMDETRWMVFVEVEGKDGYRWWLWVVITEDTVVYILDPTRSAKVPHNHLGKNAQGIINADRFSAYKTLGENIFIAFCWSHVRRDFINVYNGYRSLRPWAQRWIKRINELFEQNKKRLRVISNPQAFREEDRILRQAIDEMARIRDSELADPRLHQAARGAIKSLREHWQGCILFVDHPQIPMDNNESERRLREPVLGRKNYYGSGSIWSGTLTVILFTIFQTLLKNNIEPQKWFFSYFDACAHNGGCYPENIDAFLPWNLSQEQKEAWHYPNKHPP